MLDAGVNVGIGTDSTSLNDDDDILQEIGLSQRLHRTPGLDTRRVSPGELLHMATLGGAKALTLEDSIGSLEPGKRADIVLLNWDRVAYPISMPNSIPSKSSSPAPAAETSAQS